MWRLRIRENPEGISGQNCRLHCKSEKVGKQPLNVYRQLWGALLLPFHMDGQVPQDCGARELMVGPEETGVQSVRHTQSVSGSAADIKVLV